MADLVHRAHQLLQKQFLIIHPTADGKKALFAHFNAYLNGKYGILRLSSIFFSAEKVHFQHTAKFINHLISEKANYTLQVRLQSILGVTGQTLPAEDDISKFVLFFKRILFSADFSWNFCRH